ncbi:MAG: hypothetical protein ACRCV5_08270 [Afipia sp.]
MLEAVRSYFSGIAAGLGYEKHYDGFATDNIPSTRFNKTYHVSAFNFTGSGLSNGSMNLIAPVTVRLFFKAYKEVDNGIATATVAGEAFIEEALASENRLGSTALKNVVLDSIVVEPYSTGNDNWVVCRLEFRAFMFKGIC